VEERLRADLAAEVRGRETLVAGVALCDKKLDYVSRDLLVQILDDTEEHIDFLETQLSVLAQVGLQNYLQSQYDLEDGAH
jgi:bacterioferritin